jgi:hypothetical protein
VSEIVVRNAHWLQTVYSCVHVEAGLDVIARDAQFLELLGSPAHGERQSLVLLGYPAALHSRLFLLVPVLLLVLAKQSSDWLDGLLQLHLPVVPSRQLIANELRLSPRSERGVLLRWELALVFSHVAAELLCLGMLGKGRLEVRTVHPDVSLLLAR